MLTTLEEFVHALRFVVDQDGWKALPGFLIYPLLVIHSAYILRGSLKEAVLPIAPPIPITLREATLKDLPKFQKIVNPIRIKRFARKMEKGESCAVAILNDEVIAYVWASFTGTPTTKEVPFQLGPKETYLWGAFCQPEYRSQGVFTSLASYHEYSLCQKGFETSFRFTNYDNQAILKMCKRLNVQVAGHLTSISIFGKYFFRYKIGTPVEWGNSV